MGSRRPGGRAKSPFVCVLPLAVAALAAAAILSPARALSAASATEVLADADAYTSAARPKKNFGRESRLRVSSAPVLQSYVRFTVPTPTAAVTHATLRVWTTGDSATGFNVFPVAGTWSERTITYANAPAAAPAVTASSGPFSSGRWLSLDVTPLVAGAGTVSLVLAGAGAADLSLASREAGASTAPRLVVDTAAPPATAEPFSLLTMTGEQLYPSGPWNTPIAAAAPVDPASTVLVGSLRQAVASGGFVTAVKRWTVPVYAAAASTPRYDVQLTASWRAADWMLNVPIPNGAAPDPAGDGHMAIFDPQSGCQYDFYEAAKTATGWSAKWANSIRFNSGTGVFAGGLSARGSGFATTAGVMWPAELGRGEIRHALMFSYPYTKAGGPVAPATESDGQSTRSDSIPEGARLQLDPTLNLDALGLNAYEKTIARALQRYGMFLGDSGAPPALYAINPQSYGKNPYASVWGDQTYVSLAKIPVDRFRVLQLPQQTRSRFEVVDTGCATLR